MLNLEFSWGKWSGEDIKALQKPISRVIGRVGLCRMFLLRVRSLTSTHSCHARVRSDNRALGVHPHAVDGAVAGISV